MITRVMNENERKYVKILNKNNQINITPIIPRFCTVQRYLTAFEMKACLNKGAQLSQILPNGDLVQLNEFTYNMIEVEEETTTEEITAEEKKEEVIVSEVVEEIPVVEEVKTEEVTVTDTEEEFDDEIEIEE